jgi:hypothetical protein
MAPSAEAIVERYPRLSLVFSKPAWITDEVEKTIQTYNLATLDDEWAPAKSFRQPQS